jgi:DNA-binding FadR family transcriptional regulator
MARLDLDSDLLEYIVAKGFQAGERLPTISELQAEEHLGISISKVREQLEVARALGIVEVRSKTGMRLREYSFTPAVRLSLFYALSANPQLFEAFSEMRNHLELAFWNEACEQLTNEDRAVMQECILAARSKLNLNNTHIQIPNDEHRAFHLRVFKRLENPFVLGVLEAYWDAYEAVEINRYADYDYHTLVWDYHERILDAICAGDYERGKELFLAHTRLRYHPNLTPAVEMKP